MKQIKPENIHNYYGIHYFNTVYSKYCPKCHHSEKIWHLCCPKCGSEWNLFSDNEIKIFQRRAKMERILNVDN